MSLNELLRLTLLTLALISCSVYHGCTTNKPMCSSTRRDHSAGLVGLVSVSDLVGERVGEVLRREWLCALIWPR
jgi:hypothetical protein